MTPCEKAPLDCAAAPADPHALPAWLLDAWLQARAAGASDLHLASSRHPVMRSHGRLHVLDALPPCPPPPWPALAPWLRGADTVLDHRRGEADGALSHAIGGRVRWNLAWHEEGLLLVLRLLPGHIPATGDVQLNAAQLALVGRDHGLLLVTGATGSGKSSTLAALVGHWRMQQGGHVLTLEDPVEMKHPAGPGQITQREVGRDCADFPSGLRAALRQDPDLILVGEIRDGETARLALTAAETGHLVLATLHAATAAGAIDRYAGLFPGEEQPMVRLLLADCLIGILAQQLVWRDGQAQACREVLVATPAVRALVREHRLAQLESVMQTGAASGMQTLTQALAQIEAGRAQPGRETG